MKLEKQILYDITYMWNLKYDTNELIYITEIDSQTREQTQGCQGEGVGGGDGLGVWDQQTQTVIYKMDKQQGTPAVQHRQLYSVFCDKP